MNEETEERLAIIQYGCKVSQIEAEAIWKASQEPKLNHLLEKVERIKAMALNQKMRKHAHGVDNKTKAAGE